MTNPFDWKGKPSIVANNQSFKSYGGKSRGQLATDGLQKVYDRGINIGTVLINEKTEAGITESFKRIHRRKK